MDHRGSCALWICYTDEFRSNLKVQEVANEIGVHPFHLSRVFRSVHGQTIGEYVHKLRVNYACKQLAQADNDLATVALSHLGITSKLKDIVTVALHTGMRRGE
jgi:AraC-like DNA-binding protein